MDEINSGKMQGSWMLLKFAIWRHDVDMIGFLLDREMGGTAFHHHLPGVGQAALEMTKE